MPVSPGCFHKLGDTGKAIERSRLHMFVCDGILELALNGKTYEMKEASLLDAMDTVTNSHIAASNDIISF